MKKAVLLDVDHVSKSFILSKQRQSELILEAVSLQVQTHQFISIIGSSGVRKINTITNDCGDYTSPAMAPLLLMVI